MRAIVAEAHATITVDNKNKIAEVSDGDAISCSARIRAVRSAVQRCRE